MRAESRRPDSQYYLLWKPSNPCTPFSSASSCRLKSPVTNEIRHRGPERKRKIETQMCPCHLRLRARGSLITPPPPGLPRTDGCQPDSCIGRHAPFGEPLFTSSFMGSVLCLFFFFFFTAVDSSHQSCEPFPCYREGRPATAEAPPELSPPDIQLRLIYRSL